MGGSQGDRDRTFALAERANALMREYGPSATPRAYTVWYTYVSGLQPTMNEAVKRLTAKGALLDSDIDTLYETYLDGERLARAAERTSSTVLSEIEGVMEVLDLSLGSTAQYGESLRILSDDLGGSGLDRARVHEIVGALVATTREVTSNNRALEARMRESRKEIESLRETLEATRLESLTDPLTGLSNRKQFEESLHAMVEESVADRAPASLIVIDVDFFKRFNDVYGHLTGDQVLRLVALVMREHITARATLARFGGEEFGILLPGTDRAEACVLAEKVRASVMGRDLVKRSTGESLGKITISLGVAAARSTDTAVSLLERADQCMFRAKRDGRNRTVDDAEPLPLPDVA
ncbi:diguanylate cyclase [Methylobacterium sp. Leaf469]|jgi:diguanylate cyclase|uniref:GGDEF domain-containing protein n=1 Tax=unclassified Methylobacterium TaxID=2615210 RepID=UPI0006F34638|nr:MULTISPECIES: GGDEF domain-containing protein [unclassified Methylobacterium]USU34475.1 GGDEF domain-containing protein [Methylobacterium sp. OTU13CASTA1]KQO69018.1 diguanylate cyclase [Methylobacterium sp. Leaf87]KQP30088.1 diguanylate cyclase [Methylobacterium sp. Leaf100]KQP30139.1 diguanylate cyclase [Methylobacterium sp. Leaf102]KQP59613.1 diguanylate cyclase [Methylobacterium sp. Leaf112]